MSLNKIIMAGNLTRDVECRDVGSTQVCRFGIATNKRFKDIEEVCFVDVNAWGKLGEFAAKYFKKGSPMLLEGRLKLETWEKNGQQNSKHTIVADSINFIDKITRSSDEYTSDKSKPSSGPTLETAGELDLDDSLPF